MIREIITDSKILKMPTTLSNVDEKSFSIAQDLCDTLIHSWNQGRICRSISANQIGESERIIAIADKLYGNIITMYNPKIIMAKGEFEFWEDNLSRPQKMFKVARAFEIFVEFDSPRKQHMKVNYASTYAALIQQEIDNLNGVLPEKRAIAFADVGIKTPKFEL